MSPNHMTKYRQLFLILFIGILTASFISDVAPKFVVHKFSDGFNYYSIGIVSSNANNQLQIDKVLSECINGTASLVQKDNHFYKYSIKSVQEISPIKFRKQLRLNNLEIDPRYIENMPDEILEEITLNIKIFSNELNKAK